MMRDHTEVRASIVRVCDVIGFPKPLPDMGLTEWADEALDGTLFRGGPQWQHAHPHLLEALEAAIVGHEEGIVNALTRARGIARVVKRCMCPLTRLPARVSAHGKTWCVVCHGVVG